MGYEKTERDLITGHTSAIMTIIDTRISKCHETPLQNQAAETTGVCQNQACISIPQKAQSQEWVSQGKLMALLLKSCRCA